MDLINTSSFMPLKNYYPKLKIFIQVISKDDHPIIFTSQDSITDIQSH